MKYFIRKDNLKALVKFYEEKVIRYKDDVRSLAWGSRKSQHKRFEILSEIGRLEGSLILDVGCGLGDFYNWLLKKYNNISYTGIDITPSMIEIAKKKYPKTTFKVQNILELNSDKSKYDYIFASGIFNRRIKNHEKFVRDNIIKMFELCCKGAAFNIMSTKADFMEKKEYYAEAGKMLDFCLSLTRNVILRHDYMPHDFTVYMYK